ncbi:hypothetical protein DL98DRAFT_600804 [Cadophora sp. DSE1049]|nr:hypothetical protein DL98DRAFT_600804 [Cadophora sp. DSE1049]
MPPNPLSRPDPETRWGGMIRKLQVLGNLAVSTHDKIERLFEEEVQKRVPDRNLTSRADAVIENTVTSNWEKLWHRIQLLDRAWHGTYDDIVDMFNREVDWRVATGYVPPPKTLEQVPRTDAQLPEASESERYTMPPAPTRVPVQVRRFDSMHSTEEALVENTDSERACPRPRIDSPRPNTGNQIFNWLETSTSTSTEHSQLEREPHMVSPPFSNGIESDKWSWSLEDDGVDATDWGSQLEEALEEGANHALASMQSPPLTLRRSGGRMSTTNARRRATTLPPTGSIPRVYDINTPRKGSLTRSTAVRDPLGLRRRRFTLENQDEEGVESSNVDGG